MAMSFNLQTSQISRLRAWMALGVRLNQSIDTVKPDNVIPTCEGNCHSKQVVESDAELDEEKQMLGQIVSEK